MTLILTQADVAALAPELDLSAYSSTTISGMLNAAQQQAANFCNVAGFDSATEVDETDRAYISNRGDLTISTRRRPIQSVASITLEKGGFSTDLVLTQSGTPLYQIPTPKNKLVFPNSYFYMTGTYLAGGASQLLSLRGAEVFYKMTYTAGYTTIPDDLKYAVLLFFRNSLQKQYNTRGVTSFTQGSYSETREQPSAKGISPLVQEARMLLQTGGYCRLEF